MLRLRRQASVAEADMAPTEVLQCTDDALSKFGHLMQQSALIVSLVADLC